MRKLAIKFACLGIFLASVGGGMVAHDEVHVYDGLNAGIVVGPIGYEWRGAPGFFWNEESALWVCVVMGNRKCG